MNSSRWCCLCGVHCEAYACTAHKDLAEGHGLSNSTWLTFETDPNQQITKYDLIILLVTSIHPYSLPDRFFYRLPVMEWFLSPRRFTPSEFLEPIISCQSHLLPSEMEEGRVPFHWLQLAIGHGSFAGTDASYAIKMHPECKWHAVKLMTQGGSPRQN